MIKLDSQRFGQVEVRDESVIVFDHGLYGFENHHRFTLLGVGEGSRRLQWLQSLDNPELALLILDPTLIDPGYNPPVDPADLHDLGLSGLEEAIAMVVCVLTSDPREITANLQAPIIFNPVTRQARQVIVLDPALPVKQPVFAASAR
ncbi:MAG: flagellar assembly protein FliW [Firmicutes bacterium]|nr:flagellar assembly protein FliW [Bacillota bacterium]